MQHELIKLAGGPLGSLIDDAYQEARKYQPGKTAKLNNEFRDKPAFVVGDRNALKHAFSEIILNALQSNPASPQVAVRTSGIVDPKGQHSVSIEVQDNGPGFTEETQREATTPFFTTRIPGVGLGLAVSRKIIETHHGKLEIPMPHTGQPGVVRVSLPSESVTGKP